MITPRAPDNESERLASLRELDVLDTPAEERFDRITRIARTFFGVPVALVSLVDESRQWFKSRQGLTACQTEREISFCGHAILTDELLVVEDAEEDERFNDNPLVTGPLGIRFYAGYPLKDRLGLRLGTLCIIDTVPRSLSPVQRAMLVDLGCVAENELSALHLGAAQFDVGGVRSSEDRKHLLDELTGLWNDAGSQELLERGLAYCAEKHRPATLVVVEVTDQAGLDETWSREGGEIVQAEFAQALRAAVRPYDAVGRIGEGEFMLLLVGCAPDHAPDRTRDLERNIAANVVLQALDVRARLGLACTEADGSGRGPAELLATARASLAASRAREAAA